ncbi:MAG: GGDEF domain-containing protein [Romboutsia sp.]
MINKFINRKIMKVYTMFILGFIVIAYIVVSNITKELETYIGETLEEVSRQGATVVEYKLSMYEERVERFANFQTIKNKKTPIEDKLEALNRESIKKDFLDIGIIDSDGTGYTVDGKVFDINNIEYFKNIMEKNTTTSGIVDLSINPIDSVIHSSPIYSNGEIIGVVFASSEARQFEQDIFPSLFNGKGNIYILNKELEVIFTSNNRKIKNNNSEDKSENHIKELKYLENNLRNRKIGTLKVDTQDQEIYLGYAPVNNKSNWIMVSVVDASTVSYRANIIIFEILQVVIILFIVLLCIMKYIFNLRKKAEEERVYLAFIDEVTGKTNYSKFTIDAKNILQKRKTNNYAFVYFDIDHFEIINETFGETIGNSILRKVSDIIEEYVPKGAIYTRDYIDFFILLLPYNDNKNEILGLLDDICNKVKNITITGMEGVDIFLTMGIYYETDEELSIRSKINKADTARLYIKGIDTVRYKVFCEDMRLKQIEEIHMSKQIKEALKNNEFEVYYQPKIDVITEKIVGCEALIRWKNNFGEFIMPDKFIPIAEKNGFIHIIDRWVFLRVCSDIKIWNKSGFEINPISINVSRINLYRSDLIELIKEHIKDFEIDPSLIEIEITETIASKDLDLTIKKLNELKSLGLKISMDDFGVGQSSLSNLRMLPIDILKLDRGFIVDIENDSKSRKIIKTIIELAKSLELKVVAEGVENKAQRDYLEALGCDIIQGYYYAKPMDKGSFEKFAFDRNINI